MIRTSELLIKTNCTSWHNKMMQIFCFCSVEDYVEGTLACPDLSLNPQVLNQVDLAGETMLLVTGSHSHNDCYLQYIQICLPMGYTNILIYGNSLLSHSD